MAIEDLLIGLTHALERNTALLEQALAASGKAPAAEPDEDEKPAAKPRGRAKKAEPEDEEDDKPAAKPRGRAKKAEPEDDDDEKPAAKPRGRAKATDQGQTPEELQKRAQKFLQSGQEEGDSDSRLDLINEINQHFGVKKLTMVPAKSIGQVIGWLDSFDKYDDVQTLDDLLADDSDESPI